MTTTNDKNGTTINIGTRVKVDIAGVAGGKSQRRMGTVDAITVGGWAWLTVTLDKPHYYYGATVDFCNPACVTAI